MAQLTPSRTTIRGPARPGTNAEVRRSLAGCCRGPDATDRTATDRTHRRGRPARTGDTPSPERHRGEPDTATFDTRNRSRAKHGRAAGPRPCGIAAKRRHATRRAGATPSPSGAHPRTSTGTPPRRGRKYSATGPTSRGGRAARIHPAPRIGDIRARGTDGSRAAPGRCDRRDHGRRGGGMPDNDAQDRSGGGGAPRLEP